MAKSAALTKTIAHIIVGLDRGGAEGMLVRLATAKYGSADGYKHCVVSLTTDGFYGNLLRKKGVEVYSMDLHSIFHLPLVFFRLILFLRKLKPNIVQTWMVHSDLIGGLAGKFAGVSHVIWGIRTTDYRFESFKTRLVRRLCIILSRFVPSAIVAAAFASRQESLASGYRSRNFTVIHNGFDLDFLKKYQSKGELIRKKLNIRNSDVLIGCVGRYNVAKDHNNFIHAAKLISEKYENCYFLMIGRYINNKNSKLLEKIQKTGFSDRFILLGERSDIPACLDALDVFVLSSVTEGFPNVLGEAMAMQVPCVSTNVGDAAILLGNTGRLVPPQKPDLLARAVEDFVIMPPKFRAIEGIKEYKRLKKSFSIEVSVNRFETLYSTLISDGN